MTQKQAPTGSTTEPVREKVEFFDVLRCLAALAVVAIHVLGPYRDQLGVIPDADWITAITVNSASRWAVPVFIMITGALMLSDQRPFELGYYLKRRVGKVLVPFLVWSCFYALLSGLTLRGFDSQVVWDKLLALPVHETYYHLGFFYYFLPLYIVVPFFRYAVQHSDRLTVIAMTLVWLTLTTLFLFHIDGPWSHQLVLYSGYLLWGYCLFQYQWPRAGVLWGLGLVALVITDYSVLSDSFASGQYTVGRWLSYKTLNTALIAAAVFALGRYVATRCSARWMAGMVFMSRYSLGIYLLHPLFLWPVRAFDGYVWPPVVMIPLLTVLITAVSLAASWLLAKSAKTAWLVP
ncbi:acyltransferase [Photobacterium aphoticum]|uniref:Membrane protein n=1 Tax=Photobacterium aphoticum TaxID=754436 RepID=A0A0J1JHZ2_9GAMM|nr:acyltransferase [Photobacterium aphoticum]KLV01562.1 membrane protein [Photobacterium aphoticum]PSU51363.1 acyltransferase [Photobacterium aphoticum]GHA43436.1 membrane protein [Photobacterium aphoticum]